VEKPFVYYTLFDRNRKVQNELKINITSARMIHEFLITNEYIIIPDLPLEFKGDKVMSDGTAAYQLDTSQPARYGIMKKIC